MCAVDLGADRRQRLADARLYLICDGSSGEHELPDLVRDAVAGGVDVIQLREKRLPDDELVAVANAARALCERLGVLLIINDRPGVALAAGADGVHLGQDDQPLERTREQVGPDVLIGLSTHSPAQLRDSAGADYVGVGPVYATPTKPDVAPVGLEMVRHAAQQAAVPFFAIGGIDDRTIGAVLDAGARRVAVVRAIGAARDVERAARTLRDALERSGPVVDAAPG